MLLLNLLHRGESALAALLSVEREGDRDRLGTGAANDIERLAHRCPRRDHVIDNQNTPVQRGADHFPTLAVVFRLFTVESVGHVPVMVLESATTVAVASGIPL